MPNLMNVEADEVHKTVSNFKYSAIEIDKLEGSEYTVVQILVDATGSVYNFKTELESAVKSVVESCKKSPRSENLLIRVATFNSNGIEEVHGFTLLSNINVDDYDGCVVPAGMTPLWDASLNAVEALQTYGKQLFAQEYLCNGIFFVITDGGENSSRVANLSKIKSTVASIRQNEELESVDAILIGVNDTDTSLKRELDDYKTDAGFDQYVSLGDVSPSKLAKLAQWVSNSISSTSQVLGTGGASQPVSFTI
jgi:uncharacterized protein YegL